MDWNIIVTAIISGILGPALLLIFQHWKSRQVEEATAAEMIVASAEKVVGISEGIIVKLEEELEGLQGRVNKLEKRAKRLHMSNLKLRKRVRNLEHGVRKLTEQLDGQGVVPAWTPTAFFDRTIVIVDDNAAFRKTLSGSLGLAGYDISEASNSDEVRDELEHDDHVVILLDMRLEDENGLDVFKMIRKFNSAIPVIIVSAYLQGMSPETLDALSELNAYVHLPKPLAIEELIKTLCRIRSDELVASVNSL